MFDFHVLKKKGSCSKKGFHAQKNVLSLEKKLLKNMKKK